MVVVYATLPPEYVMTALSAHEYQSPMRASKRLDHSESGDNHSAASEAEHNTTPINALQAKHDNIHILAGAIQYDTCTDRESQIEEHLCRKRQAIAQLVKHWSGEIEISAQYHAYKVPLIDILSQLQSMWNGHLGRVSISKQRIQPLQRSKR